jgi:hypothetical protein
MNARRLVAPKILAWAAVWATLGASSADPSVDEPPKPTALTEKIEKRLVQLDVAVDGDREAIRRISEKDLVLYVGEREIQGLIVDPACADVPAPPESPTQSAAPLSPAVRPRATFTLFFDQPHLTTAGRSRSLETSTELINRLVVHGARASIVSNAKRLETIVPLTEDRDKLLAGLERLRRDPSLWDSYADGERTRAQEIIDVSAFGGGGCPPLIAKAYERDEFLIARRSTERLAVSVGALAEAPTPKALVYFGDSLRQSAGLHYLHIIPCGSGDRTIQVSGLCGNGLPAPPVRLHEVQAAEMTPSAAAEFDAVINEALARGVHFFTIQAEGLGVYTGDSLRQYAGKPSQRNPHISERNGERHRAAQDALVGLAAETGGEAFLGGASDTYIANRIEARSSCRLLLSFPPGDLPRDKAMSVTLELHTPKVKIHTPGRIVVPSPASIEKSRLLNAFVDPASSDDGSLRAILIPRGGDGKTWKAAVQLRLQPTGLPDNSAELGASVVRRDKVSDHFASSIATASGTRAMVLEKTLDVAPGAFAVVAVARDAKRGDVGSRRLEADWPNPAKSAAAIAPIAVLQKGSAAISADGAVRSSGSVARDADEPLDPSAGVSLESVVCRGAKTTAPVVVERWFDGGAPRDAFPPMTIAETDAPCVQTVDVVPAGQLRPGVIDYRIVARVGDEIVAQERRTLRVGVSP